MTKLPPPRHPLCEILDTPLMSNTTSSLYGMVHVTSPASLWARLLSCFSNPLSSTLWRGTRWHSCWNECLVIDNVSYKWTHCFAQKLQRGWVLPREVELACKWLKSKVPSAGCRAMSDQTCTVLWARCTRPLLSTFTQFVVYCYLPIRCSLPHIVKSIKENKVKLFPPHHDI